MSQTGADDPLAERLREAGLVDPDAPDAESRLALLRFALEQGVEIDELHEADRLGRLAYVAGDPHIRPGDERLTLGELADRAEVPADEVVRPWTLAALPVPAGGERVATDADLHLVRLWRAVVDAFGDDVAAEVLRAMGEGLSKIAETECSLVASRIGQPLMDRGDLLGLAHANVALAQLLPDVARAMDLLHRHHIETAITRWLLDPTTRESEARPLAVGFADLSGFTELAGALSAEELAALIDDFERFVRERATSTESRVVKMIGDEAMFVANEPAVGAGIAIDLAQATSEFPLRAGVAYGDVLTFQGDYFGEPVSLAARLVAIAEPQTVLIPTELAHRLQSHGSPFETRDRQTVTLKGFRAVDACVLQRRN